MTDRSGADDLPADDTPSIAPDALAERLRSGDELSVLDVRDRDEFDRWHLTGDEVDAVQIPHTKFIQAQATGGVTDLVADLEEPILAVCGRGEASAHAVGLLQEAGVEAYNLAGGMDAWAELYTVRELEVDAPATVLQYDRPSSGCLAYAIHSGGEAAVIDPLRAFADRYAADTADAAELKYAIDTHVHADHVSGVRTLADRTAATAVVPAGATDRGLAFDATTLEGGDELRVGDATLSVLATPGHTTESISLRLEGGDSNTLYTGDTLFLEGVGRPDLERGDEGAADAARRLYESIQDRILAQSDETMIAPGHYSDGAKPRADGTYATTLATLRTRLDALSMDEAEFVAHATSDLPPRPANHDRIVAANLGLEAVDEETAFELELGPNNCAVAD
ncbi:MBL fold metallo-hydrolase [Natrinema salaciae]|uniref:Glyoxylase, beta-lactamase superfamily II n=1 Tax=Natrinema salaciae TaxID=1186196 RepID=A0A1H9QD82_9EURY|nr:MBL fold metallo-hydrolase [Natrinema salaciae]SER58372.1 Glyoxylase, beta-lactamase superfamily II [Natrinema salaciae]